MPVWPTTCTVLAYEPLLLEFPFLCWRLLFASKCVASSFEFGTSPLNLYFFISTGTKGVGPLALLRSNTVLKSFLFGRTLDPNTSTVMIDRPITNIAFAV